MIAFEVSINGKRRYVAGHADARVLNTWLHGSISDLPGIPKSCGMLSSVAVPSGQNGHLATLAYPDDRLVVGDEIVIRIVEVDSADAPAKRNDGDANIELVASE